MGTRNLVCVFSSGRYAVAQYGQWDGYPEGQGVKALEFARSMNATDFREKLKLCRFLSEEEIQARWVECGAGPGDLVPMSVSDELKRRYPTLSRDAGADVLRAISKADAEVPLRDSLAFAGDSLFCEWVWVIDLDRGTFEGFKGFNNDPVIEGERFAHLVAPENTIDRVRKNKEPYYPCRKVGEWRLETLPTEEDFIEYFEKLEAEIEANETAE